MMQISIVLFSHTIPIGIPWNTKVGQKLVKSLQRILKPLEISRGFDIFRLFKLYRSRWFPGAVVHDAVDVVDFVDDAGGHAVD